MEVLHKNEERITQIGLFMKELLDERSPYSKREIYDRYQTVIDQIKPIDLFYLDMYKEQSEYTIDEIKQSAGKFVNVFYSALDSRRPLQYNSNLFTMLIQENRSVEKQLDTLKPYFHKSAINNHVSEIIKGFESMFILERKFIKREHVLWPSIEEKLPSTMPLKVLWSLHDDARVLLKEIIIELHKETIDINSLVYMIGEYYYLIYGVNQKEELILFPIADQLLSQETKDELYAETIEYGYCFVEQIPQPQSSKTLSTYQEGILQTPTGNLTLKEIEVLLGYLPLDITFVNQDDKVQYFNNRPERHFPRNPSIIGRLVKYCHPPKSVAVVEKIITSFKNGEQDFAEFWIDFRGTFLYITYYAVRDKNRQYMGVLEVSQDVTRIRELQGQQHLLSWD